MDKNQTIETSNLKGKFLCTSALESPLKRKAFRVTTKTLMTWRPESKRWVKRHGGVTVYASYRTLLRQFPELVTAPTKEGTRDAANAFWEQHIDTKSTKPKLPAEYERIVGSFRQMRDWYLRQGDHEAAAQCSGQAADLETRGLSPNPQELSSIDDPLRQSEIGAAIWNDRFQQMNSKVVKYSVALAIREFLDFKRSSVAAENLTADSWEALRCHLQILDAFKGGDAVALTEIDEQYVQGFYTWLTQKVVKKQYSPFYAHSIFGSFKHFVRYHWGFRRLEIPRNLDERRFAFKRRHQAIILWEKDEISRFMLAANDRTRLYALLSLNCGFYSSDIATLTFDEVDFTQGRITRKRHKTEDHATAPVVCWKLWPETLRLLIQEQNSGITKSKKDRRTSLVLLNDEGRPLRTTELTDKFRKSDNVRSAISRVCSKLKLSKTAKQFRKTAASKLEEHETFGRYVQHFLGHAPSSVASKHYVVPSQEQFEKALSWLGKALGMDGSFDASIRKHPA